MDNTPEYITTTDAWIIFCDGLTTLLGRVIDKYCSTIDNDMMATLLDEDGETNGRALNAR